MNKHLYKIKFYLKMWLRFKYCYLFSRSSVYVNRKATLAKGTKVVRSSVKMFDNSCLTIEKGVKIIDSEIIICSTASLHISQGCILDGYKIKIYNDSQVEIGNDTILEQGSNSKKPHITISDGSLVIGNHNRIRSDIEIRFDGCLKIGEYNNINEDTEIRCDESVIIGDFNQISYKCVIWDTNTHNIYSREERRKMTRDFFPLFGMESEKPKTLPVYIGSDCWIGREAAILKGGTMKDFSVLGFRGLLSNKTIDEGTIFVSKQNNLTVQNQHK